MPQDLVLMTSNIEHLFRWWLGAVRHQAITRINIENFVWRHMASLGPTATVILRWLTQTRARIAIAPMFSVVCLTHWGKIIVIASDNGLSSGRCQAIIWTNAGILLIGPLGINLSEMSVEIGAISFKKMHLKMSSAKWRLFRLGLNEFLIHTCSVFRN